MMRRLPLLAALLALAPALGAQSLTERFKDVRAPWEIQIDRGDAPGARKGIEALLGREGVSVNPSDYNDMHALVALHSLAAKACVAEGSWEDAVAHLQRAQAAADENLTNATALLSKTRAEHQAKLQEFQAAIAQQAPRLKELDEAPGLDAAQIKLRQQLRIFMEEQKAAIAQSQKSIADIDTILARLQQDKESTAKALADWQAFLAREKAEIAEAGSPSRYVAEKLLQVKADTTRPQAERLAYARRLEKLDPGNQDTARLVDSLLGKEEQPAPLPRPMKSKKKTTPKKG